MKIGDLVSGGQIRTRAIVMQQKTGRPLQFELPPDARASLLAWLDRRGGMVDDHMFPSRVDHNGHLSTRQYSRLVDEWVTGVGLMRSEYGTHSLRRTKASIIYRATGNLRAVQMLLGHSKIETTVRYLGIDVEDGSTIAITFPDGHQCHLAKPGAIVAFQEHGRAGLPAGNGDLVLHRQLYNWSWSTVAAEGGDVGLALRLADTMRRVGLSVEEARGEAILLDPEQPSFLPTLTQMMLPRMVERGVATAEQVDMATLPQRIEDEQRAAGGLIVWDLAFFIASRA